VTDKSGEKREKTDTPPVNGMGIFYVKLPLVKMHKINYNGSILQAGGVFCPAENIRRKKQ